MDNVTFNESNLFGLVTEHVTINKGNGEFETMPKAEYDRRQAEQSTPNLAE